MESQPEALDMLIAPTASQSHQAKQGTSHSARVLEYSRHVDGPSNSCRSSAKMSRTPVL